MSDMNQELVSRICERVRDEVVGFIVQTTLDLEAKLSLSHEQGCDIAAPILTNLTSKVVDTTLELCIELVKEQHRSSEQAQ